MSDIYKDWKEMPKDLQWDGHNVGLCQLGSPHEGQWAIETYADNARDVTGFDNIHYILPPCVQKALEWMRECGATEARDEIKRALRI